MDTKSINSNNDYLIGKVYIHNDDLAFFAEKHNKTIEQVLIDIATKGWIQGIDNNGNNEYWE